MYITFGGLYPMMRHVCSFGYDDSNRCLTVNKRQLNIPDECYENAKIALTHAIAHGVNFIHEQVLCDPHVTDDDFDIVYESIQAFLKHKENH